MRRDRVNRIVGYTLSRVEAYLIVGLVFAAVVVAIVGRWPGWVIAASVIAGVVLLGLLIVDSLSDPNVARDASTADVDLGRIGDQVLRAKVRRALDYVRAAHKLARRDTSGVLDAADDELPQMEQAARSIYQMSLRLQEFGADRLLQQDLADLQQRESRQDPLTRDQQAQLRSLRRLDELVRKAEQEIDSSLAHLGQSYAEMQAIKVTPEIQGRAVESLDQLEASTKRLSEMAEGYDKVYGGRRQPERS